MPKELEKGFTSKTPEQTREFAARVAEMLGCRGCVTLSGDLGAGKTVFAKGLADALGVDVPVKSPSYNVCLTYEGARGSFVHVDAYRLKGPADFDSLLLDEIVPGPKLLCVEWPEVVLDALPTDALHLRISIVSGTDCRLIQKI